MSDVAPRRSRSLIVLLVVIGVLLLVAIGVLVAILSQLQGAEAHQTYLDCMARYGYRPDEMNADIDGMADAAGRCDR
ncbi:hypothetical protein [Microbacterium allomyrinae]|uniref:Uncharacterized protein n=1 Tax=Microbacterium allomyrinae TaxID=2830666 RepID=A0A9X1S2T0_9MICO|nr:hypothetical protein [Microbacterium allomyrinae]MCC2032444.1 hypothetical protein [Microbacterium allomyrinae]